jgi:hypothetical protein
MKIPPGPARVWFALALLAASPAAARAPQMRFGVSLDPAVVPAITNVSLGTLWAYNSKYPPQTVFGDGWATTWADDDNIYAIGADVSVFQNTGVSSNTNINTLSTPDLRVSGTTINQMAAWGQPYNTNTGSPARSHKIAGLIALPDATYGSILYAVAWRLSQDWSTAPGVNDGTIIKSTDHGASWTPVPPATALPYASVMFPGLDFPYGFVQYGKNYGLAGPDNSANYVYATVTVGSSQTDTALQNLTTLKLARVPIGAIGNLAAADWQYWVSGDGNVSGNWSSSVAAGGAVINSSDGVGGNAGIGTGMIWLPRYKKYLYVSEQTPNSASQDFTIIKWWPWICDHPWGPCTQYPPATWNPQGLYMPGAIAKSLVNGGQQVMLTGSGASADCCGATGRYTMWYIPVTITP